MNQVKAGAVLNYVIIILNMVVGLAYTPYMLRCLGQNEYGLYSLVSSIIAYLTILDFGFGNAIIRYTAKFKAQNKLKEQWEMFGMFVIVYSIIGLIAFGGGLTLFFNVDALFNQTMESSDLQQAQVMMLLLTFNLAFTFPFSIFGSIITAYEDFVFQKIVQIIRIILSTVTIIILLYFGYKAIAMVVVQTIFNIGILLINFFYCRYKIKIKFVFTKFNWPFFQEILIYSFWLFLNAIMDRVYWSTGQFVLGTLSGTVTVAIFSVGITLQQMYMTFSTGISSVLLPRITYMVTTNRSNKEISDIFITTGRLQSFVLFLITGGFVVFGNGFINLWAGKDYDLSYWITLIFFVSLFVPLIQNVGVNILQARNQMKFRSLCYVVIAAVSLVFQIVLSKKFGPIGCASSIGGALILGQGFVMNMYYWKSQNLDIPKFWKEIGKISITPIILMIFGVISQKFINYNNPVFLISGILIYILIYLGVIWSFSMNNYEKNLILRPIRNIHNKSKSI